MTRRFALLLTAILSLLMGCERAPTEPAGGPVQQVGGYTLYFGIVPTTIAAPAIGAHSQGPLDAHGLPRGDYRQEHHLLVVAERTCDRSRVSDAQVEASVPISGQTVSRTLQPMPINGAMSYGGVFVLPGPGRYVFTTTLRLPGAPRPIVARFAYTLAHDPRP